jgi:hexosaminidase
MMRAADTSVYIILLFVVSISSCKQQDEKITADDLAIRWTMGENNYQGKGGFSSAFTLLNKGQSILPSSGWNIYFNFVRFIKPESVTGNVKIRHINGDFYVLSPADNFKLAPNDSIKLEFVSSDWAISETDGPAGLYLVREDSKGNEEKPEIIQDYAIRPFVNDHQSKRADNDLVLVANAAVLYEKYNTTKFLPADKIQSLVPMPVSFNKGAGSVSLSGFEINASSDLEKEKQFLNTTLTNLLETSSRSKTHIQLKIGDVVINGKKYSKGSEAYTLEVGQSAIIILGSDAEGVFYGIQSLRSLIPVEAWSKKNKEIKLDQLSVKDFPRFHYRGIHLDVARNFQKKSAVLKMLDVMAFYKLNKLHFHLSDDEGWRVEMKSLHELTNVGSKRGHDKSGKGMLPSYGSGPDPEEITSYGNGYYTEDDFIEILKYAQDRHIEIIPKIDLPGHARAAIKAMDARYDHLQKAGKSDEASKYLLRDLNDSSVYRSVQQYNDNVICVCQESTYEFIRTVVRDFKSLYQKADVTFNTFHIGADEVPHGVWEKSPACEKFTSEQEITTGELPEYFYKRVSDILRAENLNMGGWEEIALTKKKTEKGTILEANSAFVKSNFRPYVWNSVWGWGQEDVGYKLANAGYPIVLGNVTNLYFDLAYEKHPEEPGYYWGSFIDTRKVFEFNPFDIYKNAGTDRMGNSLSVESLNEKVRLTENGKKNILGIQGQLWAENLKGQERLEYLAFPKLLALAERAWASEPAWSVQKDKAISSAMREDSWNQFANTLGQRELPRLDQFDTKYRISPPGAIVKDGKLFANVEYPGLKIHYTTDGSEPEATSSIYKEPVAINGNVVKLKSFNTGERTSRTVVVLNR